jgi:hypothetical protein
MLDSAARTAELRKQQHERVRQKRKANLVAVCAVAGIGTEVALQGGRYVVCIGSSMVEHSGLSRGFVTIFLPYACALVHGYTSVYAPSDVMVECWNTDVQS